MPDRAFLFELPPEASPQLRAVTELAEIVDTLRDSLEKLAEAHVALSERVDALDDAAGQMPSAVCWRDLDPDAARELWAWLVGWTNWMVERYGLAQDLGACWPAHPPLVEELTALCLSWHHAYAGQADPEAPLRWHEALHRARQRWQLWDTTRCRHGQHSPPNPDTAWAEPWPQDADQAVAQDIDARLAQQPLAPAAGGIP